MSQLMNGKRRGYVYFLVSDALCLVKIGGTNLWYRKGNKVWANVNKRISQVCRVCPVPLRLATVLTGVAFGNESQHHSYFRHYRYQANKEWFWYLDDLKDYIDTIAAYQSQMDNYITASERYTQMLKADPDAERDGRIQIPEMPTNPPWLDFGKPPPLLKNTPASWSLIRPAD
ncbi:hypothetical protein [Anatilimnocola floriformis]|uniref:hypothetical protein n=1 Tax=Anatilimnocola floriformis TaxID=2948575 RepID=UPI0020C51505|nr:hypothetical protein [Anatilimnocola floriformis]